ncbi:MAG: hypothetical protein WCZ65_06305 [Lysobacteraceae bacterium]
MSAAHAPIEPFWQRLRAIATYPFRGEALLVLIVLGLLQPLSRIPVLGWLIGLLLLAAAYKYAFTVLRDSANGYLEPRTGVLDVGDMVVFKFLLLNIVLGILLLAAIMILGLAALWPLVLLFSAIQPAATMSLAMDDDLGNAMNPATWLAIATRIGWPYLALCLLLAVFQASAANAGTWLARFLPWLLSDILVAVAFLWGLIGTFHLMGYLLYQYHEELAFEPGRHQRAAEAPRNRDEELVEAAGVLVREGRSDEAIALLREQMASRAIPLAAHDLFRRLLRQAGAQEEMSGHARTYLHLLIVEKQERRALGLIRECLDADSAFAPPEPEDGLALAARAQQLGQSQLAVDILLGVSRAHPRLRVGARASLQAAQLLAERFGKIAEARAVLERAHENCRDDELRADIEAALKALPAD